jgi:uncharacterized protein (DUF952 family)
LRPNWGIPPKIEQFQQKCVAVLRSELRKNKEIEHSRDSEKNGNALAHLSQRVNRSVMATIYKICPEILWREAERKGTFRGAPVDLSDGFIHFSTAGQVGETAARHFRGQDGLLLIAVDEETLGTDLRYEVSRGGALFPHLYAALDPAVAKWVKPLQFDGSGRHIFPPLEA